MTQARRSPEKLLEAYEAVKQHGSIGDAAAALGMPYASLGNVYRDAVRRLGVADVRSHPKALAAMPSPAREYDGDADNELAVEVPITDGVIVAFGDAHWRSLKQPRSLAHEALLRLLPHLRPTHLLAMGDMLDLAAIGRHDVIMWEDRPTVMEEVAAAQTHLGDIRAEAPDADCIWVIGNHDLRFDRFLANNAAAYAGMVGTRLADHFDAWQQAYRVDVPGVLVALHSWHNGVHAAHNNTMKGGVSTLTGHTHQLTVRPHSDFTGRRWGVETGTLADPNWPQFHYCLGQTQKAAPGFAVLTVRGGRLLAPEVAEVVDGVCWFRGEALAGRWRTRRRAGAA